MQLCLLGEESYSFSSECALPHPHTHTLRHDIYIHQTRLILRELSFARAACGQVGTPSLFSCP